MGISSNVYRVLSQADLNTTPYTINAQDDSRATVVDDPLGQRGPVVQITRLTGDVWNTTGGKRAEITRDALFSEKTFTTGGCWWWMSYMFGDGWQEAVNAGDLDAAAVIFKQLHASTGQGIHPRMKCTVESIGCSLIMQGLDDEAGNETKVHTWPLDKWVWHDIVFGANYHDTRNGRFLCLLDHKLIYREEGPQVYPGADSLGYWKEGIYVPGAELSVDSLTIYTQGWKLGLPPCSYSTLTGRAPELCRTFASSRNVAVRLPATRVAAASRSVANGNIVL